MTELPLGTQTRLCGLPQPDGSRAWLLVEDGIVLGAGAAGWPSTPGVVRLAPRRGFTRTADSG